jgi:hypothetical protein
MCLGVCVCVWVSGVYVCGCVCVFVCVWVGGCLIKNYLHYLLEANKNYTQNPLNLKHRDHSYHLEFPCVVMQPKESRQDKPQWLKMIFCIESLTRLYYMMTLLDFHCSYK